MEQETRVTEKECTEQWVSMLNIFKDLTKDNPSAKAVKDELLELIEEAKNTILLTPAQKCGIIERCKNYMNETYGRNLSVVQ